MIACHHQYSMHAGKTMPFLGMDTEELYHHNCKHHPEKMQAWHHIDPPIYYAFNQQGFRSDEFDSTPGIMFLGCSHTVGIGVAQPLTWPVLVSKKFNRACWNLAIGGGAMDTCFRMCYHYIDQLNPDLVVLLCPPEERIEWHCDLGVATNVNTLLPNRPPDEWKTVWDKIFPLWIQDHENVTMNTQKNLMAIKHLCEVNGKPLLVMNQSVRKQHHRDHGRDLNHPGINSNRLLADWVIKSIQSNHWL